VSKKIIIVESPSKSKTISSYVGKDVLVLSSKGHIRDLATSGIDGLGLDIKNNFKTIYQVIQGKQQLVKDLIKYSKGKEVLIATDPDREGEAIGWHLAEILGLDASQNNRIVFREITKNAVLEALNHARPIDQQLVYSQEARRILDRIIGFKLSKLLQSKIKSKSAGRVQSVALKLIVDLEKEIESFIPETYYEIDATFSNFVANYIIEDKIRLNKEQADHIVNTSNNPFIVKKIEKKESKRGPKPPFITSTLQQDAISNLNMSSQRTMMVAQSLYEGIEINKEIVGLITYMRTDSTRLAEPFIKDCQTYIEKTYGKAYLGKYSHTKKDNSQDAHEAIRPTSIDRTPESIESYLSKDEFRLYKRIYNRTVASLMSYAIYDTTKVLLETNSNMYEVNGSVMNFLGHQKVYNESKTKDKIIPNFELNQELFSEKVESIEKVTQPKARFSEATLIKELESLGIGRPSTYAQIIQTLKNRDYVEIEEKRFKPSKQGRLTTEQLDLYFDKIINVEYTSKMETVLDEIAEGKQKGSHLISRFYHSFIPLVEIANKEMKKIGPKETGELCPLCSKPLVIRTSKYGEFTACSGFPRCKYVKKD